MKRIAQSFALGITAGLRSMTPPALGSWAGRTGQVKLPAPMRWIATPLISDGLMFWALVELLTDKLPFLPSRTLPPILGWRVAVGSVAGVARAEGGLPTSLLCAVVGAAGAFMGAFGGMWLRQTIGRVTGLPDQVVASAEDIAAVSLALWALEE